MIKEYNFPNIFQNVIGNVVPGALLQRRDQSFLYPRSQLSDDRFSAITSESSDMPYDSSLFWVKSKRKKLVRRVNCTKTMNPLTYRLPVNKENLIVPQESKHSNYLKKKSIQEEERFQNQPISIPITTDPIGTITETQTQSQQTLYYDSLSTLNNLKTNRKKFFKMRTSMDCPKLDDEIQQQQNEGELRWNIRNSNSSEEVQNFPEPLLKSRQQNQINSLNSSNNSDQSYQRNNQKKYTFKSNKSKKDLKEKSQRKKTVLFAAGTNSPTHHGNTFSRKPHHQRQGTLYSKYSNAHNSRKSKISKGDYLQDDLYCQKSSKWTDKSLKSLDFNSNNSFLVRSKKSGRSIESHLKSELNTMFKGRKQTKARTVKFGFDNPRISSKKQFKSLRSFEEEKSIGSRVYISHKRILSKKSLNSQKSLQDSRKKVTKPVKRGPKVSILKKQDLYLQDYDRRESMRSMATLKDTVRRNNHHRSLKFRGQDNIEQKNVYNELNNFIRFFQENHEVMCEQQIKKNFSKPIVLADETSNIEKTYNRQSFESQNLCIDMGLRLARKINRLKQKKY